MSVDKKAALTAALLAVVLEIVTAIVSDLKMVVWWVVAMAGDSEFWWVDHLAAEMVVKRVFALVDMSVV